LPLLHFLKSIYLLTMKVLLDHANPFLLAHGGFQTQIEQTKAALESIGVDVEYLRWWDATQSGDLIHFFGRPAISYVEFAHQKGMAVVLAQLLTGTGSRPNWKLFLESMCIRTARRFLPDMVSRQFAWSSFQKADACVALTSWEGHLMSYLFGAPPVKVHVVPNGVEEVFLNSKPRERGKWLVCTATIASRKRVLELGEAAVEARVPTWVIGKPYSDSDPYAGKFLELASRYPEWVRYEGPVNDRNQMAEIYRAARGFVLLSTMESLSLSALEAAACECPLLLSDLPWARTVFGKSASYCPIVPPKRTAAYLRRFYDEALHLPVPPKPATWTEVARQIKNIYDGLLSTSR
jgi:glycosyltransferase involved in cell wall biosynthesis